MEQNESLTVLLIEPERYPKVVQIGSDLKSLQQAVGGWIEAVYPWEDKAAIILNEEGKINRSIEDVGGEVLVVSQFTLYADCKKGNRPSFTQAGSPAEAERLYEYFLEECRKEFGKVEHGIFGAEMKVSLENDGPFTVIWDSREW